LLSSQPRTRLHSQYDHGSVSRETKIAGREPLWMHPHDAAARDIHDGEVVKVFNTRGALLAGVKLSEAIRPGVVQMSTGAWYDPRIQKMRSHWINTVIPMFNRRSRQFASGTRM
jgi:biotin/methionine sulfoxide reductase